jgi:hypothetical protein
VNRLDLERLLNLFEIRTDVYDLSGRDEGDEAHVITHEKDGWHVFYSERGIRTSERVFPIEDQACDEILLRIARDPLTRANS